MAARYVPSGAISGGNGDDTIHVTSNNAALQFDVFGDAGNDRIELYGALEPSAASTAGPGQTPEEPRHWPDRSERDRNPGVTRVEVVSR